MSIPTVMFEEIRSICRDAWRRNLLSGFNGNVSCRLDAETCCITCTGAAKGYLCPSDLAVVHIPSGKSLEGGRPSSELGMHLEIYRRCPASRAVVHTHPRHLLALSLRVARNDFLHIPLFEADVQRARMIFAPDFPPGSEMLARAVGEAAGIYEAVWMSRHGLCAHAASLVSALALTEELDHLAAVQLLTL